MDFDPQLPPLAIDNDRGSAEENGTAAAEIDCRQAEALFHAGHRHAAVDCCRSALPRIGNDAAMLQICAWIFSNSGCHADAAAAYRQLLLLRADWVEGHRHLSSSLAAAGLLGEALPHAAAASDAAPDNAEFALHAGSLLLAGGRAGDAAEYFARALAAEPDNPAALCRSAAAQAALDRRAESAAFAVRAAECAGSDPQLAADAAEILLQLGLTRAAIDILERAVARTPEGRLFRVLSAAAMLEGRLDTALAAAERAVAVQPAVLEYHLHQAHLLCRIGDLPAAALAIDRAAAIDPDSGELKRAQLDLFLAAGLETEAISAGGGLLERFPDDRPAAEAVHHLLTRRLDTIDGEFSVLAEAGERGIRALRPSQGWLERLASQCRIVQALIIRESRTRFADAKLGYGWALLEPILHITLLSATFSVLMHGQPPIGGQFFIFYYTGLIPYLVFVHTSSGMSHAITGNGPVLQLPPVTPFDVILARGLLEIATDIIVAVILLLGFGALGLAAAPDDLWEPSIALLVTAAFGCGCGFLNAVLTVFLRSWEKIYAQITRVLYFVSGIFYVPAMMPDWAREALAWNPVLHAIDWFRSGFFAGYQPHWLDRSYLALLAILALLTGFAAERTLRPRLSVPL